MALQGNITTFAGEIRLDQYIKIEDVTVTKDSLRVLVGYYQDKAQSDELLPPYESTYHESDTYNLGGDNPLAQGYEFLKASVYIDTLDA